MDHFYDDLTHTCIRIVDTLTTFDLARQTCEGYGEKLVTIDTHAKMLFVENMLMRHSGTKINIYDQGTH